MALPPNLQLYDRFRLWLVPQRIGLLRRSGLKEPVSVGLEVQYLSDGATCSIVSLIPAPEFVKHGEISFTGSMKGSMRLSGALMPAADSVGVPDAIGPLPIAGLDFSARSGAEAELSFTATVITPFISAMGLGSDRAEWRFDRHKEALFGRDIEAWAILALPKRQRELRYRIRYHVTTRSLFLPTRIESDWSEVTCMLNF